jgi:outer membrane protein assembly factor BamB
MKILFFISAAVVFAQSSGNFTATGRTVEARRGHTATLLADGRVLIAGGWADPEPTVESSSTAELYDPQNGTFGATGSMTTSRRYHTATLLPDGKVLIAGGTRRNNEGLASAEVYDPVTGEFHATGSMAKARSVHMAALLANGKVLVAGGSDAANCFPCPAFLLGAEIYDPVAGTFSPTADMPLPSYSFNTAISLADGKVFIGSGRNSNLFDPATGTFATTEGWGTISDDWPDAQSPLTNGRVLATGGDPDGYGGSDFAGVYDPATGRFATTGKMNALRALHAATMLPDGAALISGGQIAGGQTVSLGELYDPAAGAFTAIGPMVTSRCCHTATLLNSGQVLIVGGVTASQGFPLYNPAPAAVAELYTPAVPIQAPTLFALSSEGKQGAIWNAISGEVASLSAPARAGQILSMYTRGLVAGCVYSPQVSVGGRLAQVLWFGDAPGYPGYSQVNFRVPNDLTTGSAVPVRLIYLGRSSNDVTIAVN